MNPNNSAMSDNWEVIYTTNQVYDADIVKEVMADNDIECVIMNKLDSSYGFGEIEVCVSTENTFKAKQLILEFKGE
jgi:adenylosuccinate synthase